MSSLSALKERQQVNAAIKYLKEQRDFLVKSKQEFFVFFELQLDRTGHTQISFSEKINVDNSLVSKWLKGARSPEFAMMYDICKALELDEVRWDVFMSYYFNAKDAEYIIKIIDRELKINDNEIRAAKMISRAMRRYFSDDG